jgi:hypothetical protein
MGAFPRGVTAGRPGRETSVVAPAPAGALLAPLRHYSVRGTASRTGTMEHGCGYSQVNVPSCRLSALAGRGLCGLCDGRSRRDRSQYAYAGLRPQHARGTAARGTAAHGTAPGGTAPRGTAARAGLRPRPEIRALRYWPDCAAGQLGVRTGVRARRRGGGCGGCGRRRPGRQVPRRWYRYLCRRR